LQQKTRHHTKEDKQNSLKQQQNDQNHHKNRETTQKKEGKRITNNNDFNPRYQDSSNLQYQNSLHKATSTKQQIPYEENSQQGEGVDGRVKPGK